MDGIKIVILDFDGTLADTTSVIINTMQAVIKELGLPGRSVAECEATIGLRLTDIPSVLFPGSGNIGEVYAETYRKLFRVYNIPGAVTLFPNVLSTLAQLKEDGVVLTIASSRSRASLKHYVAGLGLSPFIDYILGADDVEEGKPNPEPVLNTLSKYGFSPEEALVVGDTAFDIIMGRSAGTYTCAVTYGNGKRDAFTGADYIIDDFCELCRLV